MTAPLTVTFGQEHSVSPLTQLRRIMPKRPLRFDEAQRIAELQAARLLQAGALTTGRVGDELITELPRLDVQYRSGLIGSGITTWERGLWRIAINADEPRARQRFTLAHELKHVIDASHEDAIYRHLPAGPARQRHIEAICDHFAACLLMPRPQVKRLWGQGIQDLGALAGYFEVSRQAMLIRLQNLGLVERPPRCVGWQRLGSVAVRGANPPPRRTYRRSPTITTRRTVRIPTLSIAQPVLQGVSP